MPCESTPRRLVATSVVGHQRGLVRRHLDGQQNLFGEAAERVGGYQGHAASG